MRIINVKDYKEKVLLGIEQADIVKRRIKDIPSWENYFLLGVLWTDDCRYLRIFGRYYLQFDVSQGAARRCFRQALQMYPKNPKVLAAIGATYLIPYNLEYDKAQPFFQLALQYMPGEPFYVWCELAVMYMLGKYEWVTRFCKTLPFGIEKDNEVFFWIQVTNFFAWLQRNELKIARECLLRIEIGNLDELPSRDDAVWDIVEAYYCVGEFGRAREIYTTYCVGNILYDSPCRNFFEQERNEDALEYEHNRTEILRRFGPTGRIEIWSRLVGHSMDDLMDSFLLMNERDLLNQ